MTPRSFLALKSTQARGGKANTKLAPKVRRHAVGAMSLRAADKNLVMPEPEYHMASLG